MSDFNPAFSKELKWNVGENTYAKRNPNSKFTKRLGLFIPLESIKELKAEVIEKLIPVIKREEIPNVFEDGVSYVEYSTPEEFESKMRYYLKNKDKCIEIGRNGYKHIKKYHTGTKRLEYMFEVMKGNDWRTALK